MFFGGGQQGRRKGPDASVDMEITLEDLYNGAQRQARISRNVICPKCRGTGAKDGKTTQCRHCGGAGHRNVQQQVAPGFVMQMQQPCEHCSGKGTTYAHVCPHCNGNKVIMEEKTLTADIEKGMKSDAEIRFERESEQTPGVTPGDVIFKLRQAEHPRFRREGDDLHHTMHISLKEALLGYDRTIRHLDGRDVSIKHSGSSIQPMEVKTIKDEGMPMHDTPSSKGRLFVKHVVDLPKKVTDQQKSALESFF